MSNRHSARIKPHVRRFIYVRDNYTCQYCFSKLAEVDCTLDHIVPRAKGGRNTRDNMVTCCSPCNHLKDDEEWPLGFMCDPVEALKKAWKVSI